MNKVKRIIAFSIAILLLLGFLSTFLTLIAHAADEDPDVIESSIRMYNNSNNSEVIGGTLVRERSYNINFEYKQKITGSPFASNDEYTVPPSKLQMTNAFITNSGTSVKLRFIKDSASGADFYKIQATIKNVTYKGSSSVDDFKLEFSSDLKLGTIPYTGDINFTIPDKYLYKDSSGGSTTSDSDKHTSDIVIENVIVTDSTGQRLDKITKDSPPFNIAIVYADYGLKDVDPDDLKNETDLEAVMTSAGGFIPPVSGYKGTLKKVASSSNDAPRFRVDFKNYKFTGTGSSIEVKVRYDILGEIVNGSFTTSVHQARTDGEDDKDKSAPPTPYIIISKFSYGTEAIQAGTKFSLNINFENTSSDIPLENIVMTVTPPDSLQIASGSNTYYIKNLEAGGTRPFSIELEALPNAKVGSSSVQIDFSYQYLVKEERKDSKTTENIAIPIIQLDRFEVDPITDSLGGMVGDEIYVPISFINRGKSPTYNISAKAESSSDITAPSEHFGNLEAGKSDTLEVRVIANVPGEIVGDIVIQYEDENTNQKEVRVPFSVYADQRYTPEPPPIDPGFDPDFGEEPALKPVQIVLSVIGSILIAAPIALYIIKRVKLKGSDDFSEDF